jgi:hypothetical protein
MSFRLPNYSTAANPAIKSNCNGGAQVRRFADWNRWAVHVEL